MFVRYPPGKIRYQGDRPAALLGVRVAPSFRLVDLPLGRLATGDRQGDLDRQAAKTIQRLLTDDGPARASPRRLGTRTWSIPAKAYWLSGPDNHHVGLRRRSAGPFHTGPSHPPRDERSRHGRRVAAGSGHLLGSRKSPTEARRASIPTVAASPTGGG